MTNVEKKYSHIYDYMLKNWNSIETRKSIDIKERVSFTLFCWAQSFIANNEKFNIDQNWQNWELHKNQIIKLNKCGTDIEISLKDSYEATYKALHEFYFESHVNRDDVIIDLGGGCGANLFYLIDSIQNTQPELLKNLNFINAEFSKEGVALSNEIFKALSVQSRAIGTTFDWNNPSIFFSKIKDLCKGKRVHFISSFSIEQIPLLSRQIIIEFASQRKISKELKVSFAEPIAHQLGDLVSPTKQIFNGHKSLSRNHNSNLLPLIKSFVVAEDENVNFLIQKICPSIIKRSNDYDYTGIQLKFL